MTDEELVKMARLAQRDDRMSTGALYGDLADRIEELEAKLAKAVAFLDDLWDSGDYFAGELNDLRKELKGARNE